MSTASDLAMAEFLAKGGVIQKAAYRESGRVEGAAYTNTWGAKKAGRPPKADVPPPEEDFGDEE
jgi:hypothetical protein